MAKGCGMLWSVLEVEVKSVLEIVWGQRSERYGTTAMNIHQEI
jgi:hypothetical protein